MSSGGPVAAHRSKVAALLSGFSEVASRLGEVETEATGGAARAMDLAAKAAGLWAALDKSDPGLVQRHRPLVSDRARGTAETAAASGLDLLARAGAVAAPTTTVRFSDSVENHGGNRGGGKKRIRPTPVEPPAREFAPQPTPTMPEAQEGTEEMFEV